MKWIAGTNNVGQTYYYPRGFQQLQIVRNRTEPHWVIYDFRGEGVEMLPNPRPGRTRLVFAEITDIPRFGERFGDRPHHDFIFTAVKTNYAWDSAKEARRYVKTLLSDTPAAPRDGRPR